MSLPDNAFDLIIDKSLMDTFACSEAGTGRAEASESGAAVDLVNTTSIAIRMFSVLHCTSATRIGQPSFVRGSA